MKEFPGICTENWRQIWNKETLDTFVNAAAISASVPSFRVD